MEHIDLNDLIAKNPGVNVGQVRDVLKTLRELEAAGVVEGAKYKLAPPFTVRRRIRRKDNADSDPRTGQLRIVQR